MRLSPYFKTISQVLIFAMLHLCWLTSYGYAEMIPTESTIEQPSTSNTDRHRLLELLDRQEVIDELEKYGISKVEATARINSLTDEEVTALATEIDRLPEGGQDYGTAAVGAFFVVIYIFMVLICIFAEDPWNDCMRNYWDFFHKSMGTGGGPSEYDYTDLEGDVIEDCDPRMESCAYGSDEEEEESEPVEEDCDPEIDSCI